MLRILLWMGHEEEDYDDPGMTAEEFWGETKPLRYRGLVLRYRKCFVCNRDWGG